MQESTNDVQLELNDTPDPEAPSTLPVDAMEIIRNELNITTTQEEEYYGRIQDVTVPGADWTHSNTRMVLLSETQKQFALSEYHKLEGKVEQEDLERIASVCTSIAGMERKMQQAQFNAANPKPPRHLARKKDKSNRGRKQKLQKAARQKGRK
jgi:hypothetical protein